MKDEKQAEVAKQNRHQESDFCIKSYLNGVLRISQYIDGDWVTLLKLELANPAEKFEDITEAVSEITKLIHDSNSVYLTNSDGDSIILMKSQGPVKVQFVPKWSIGA